MIFADSPVNNQDCRQTSYNKEKHDLYTWTYSEWPDSEPIFASLTNPGEYGGYLPNAYNQNSYIYDSNFVPDFSGKSIRPRRFGRYEGNAYHYFGRKGDPCFTQNSPENATPEIQELIKNIGNWNYGAPVGVLLSPRHVITTKHFVGPQETYMWYFLLKDDTQISRNGTRVRRDDGTDLINGDAVVYRLDEGLDSYVNDGLITIYNDYFDIYDNTVKEYFISRTSSFSGNTNNIVSWLIDGGERILRAGSYSNENLLLGTLNVDYSLLSINNLNRIIDDYQVTHTGGWMTGDSGSPLFVYDIISGKTILMSLKQGAETSWLLNYNIDFLINELSTYGYGLNLLDINNVRLLELSDILPIQSTQSQSQSQLIIDYYDTNRYNSIRTTPLNQYPYNSRLYGEDENYIDIRDALDKN